MVTTVTAHTAEAQDLKVLERALAQLAGNSPVRALLDHLRDALQAGKAATLVEQDAQLSPNQAADLIGVSRPFLLRFMNAGALKFTTAGSHRRIALGDLLEFSTRRLAAGKFVAESTADVGANEQDTINRLAPISEEALEQLGDL